MSASNTQKIVDPYTAGQRMRGTWDDPAIVNDPRIDHDNPTVRAAAERLHGNESMHMHDYVGSTICPYCALRTTRVLVWAGQHIAGDAMVHDTPWGLIRSDAL